MECLTDYLRDHAEGDLLPWRCQVEAATRFRLSLARAEEAILELGLLPARYQRNRQAFTTGQQQQLFRSRVAVIGCGGLGGYIIEELARLGVGKIVAVDPDVFEEHNLNRQLLATPNLLGCIKVEAARMRVEQINPAVTLIPRKQALGRVNGRDLLDDAQVAVGCPGQLRCPPGTGRSLRRIGNSARAWRHRRLVRPGGYPVSRR
jgi:molybdopterin-synthase adenylyltransferase